MRSQWVNRPRPDTQQTWDISPTRYLRRVIYSNCYWAYMWDISFHMTLGCQDPNARGNLVFHSSPFIHICLLPLFCSWLCSCNVSYSEITKILLLNYSVLDVFTRKRCPTMVCVSDWLCPPLNHSPMFDSEANGNHIFSLVKLSIIQHQSNEWRNDKFSKIKNAHNSQW